MSQPVEVIKAIEEWRDSRKKPHKKGSEDDLRMQGELYACKEILALINAQPSGIVTVGPVTDEQFEAFKESWKASGSRWELRRL